MSGLPRLAKAWKELYYGNLLAGYELVNEKEKILANQYDNHIAILKAVRKATRKKSAMKSKNITGRQFSA